MIKSYAMDVEIFPNLFSVTFVNIDDYLKVFADCKDEKGNVLALPDKLSVAEIKQRLNKIDYKIFWISDKDDSMLLPLVSFINDMETKYVTKTEDDGSITQTPVSTHLFGFNNQGYDDLMIKAFMMKFNRFDNSKYLINKLKEFNDKIISLQNDKEAFYQDKEIELIRKYRLPYTTVDVQKIFALDAVAKIVDKDTGEKKNVPKSLKQTSINLRWHELLDFTLPPIEEEERDAYWNKRDNYRGMPLDELNMLITNDFDRYVLPKYIDDMLYYNKNDVFLVCEIVRQKIDEIILRYSISNAFKINCLCSSRANIADKLTTKFYSDMSGLNKHEFKDGRTEHTCLSFKKIIFPHIQFKTKELQDMLEEMKKVKIYRTNKDSFTKEITFYGTTYTLATGGIHSVDPPRICKSNDEFVYLHHD